MLNMDYFKLIFFGVGLFIFCCNQPEDKKRVVSDNPTTSCTVEDKMQLQSLVRSLYEWYETECPKTDFYPKTDTEGLSYTGLDLKKHNERLSELKQTGFFSNEFLNNYNLLSLAIDEKLKNDEIEWQIGDLPPFGNGANPWYNCQDIPNNYWQIITIDKINVENNIITFSWGWGDHFSYKAKAIWENDTWKILYLEGFDINQFI